MRQKTKIIALLYEEKHVPLLLNSFPRAELCDINRFLIVATDPELEMTLEDINIPFYSLRDFHLNYPHFKLRKWVRAASENWYQTQDMSFFSYDGVLLGRGLELALSMYLLKVGFFFDLFSFLLKTHLHIGTLWVPQSSIVLSETTGSLAAFEVGVPVNVGKYFANEFNLFIVSASVPTRYSVFGKTKSLFYLFRRRAFHLFLSLHNTFIKTFSSSKKQKLFISDYWRNCKPYLTLMKDVEVVMMNRIEYARAWGYMKSVRMRFYHPEDFLTSRIRHTVQSNARRFEDHWVRIRRHPQCAPLFTYNGRELWRFVEPAVSHVLVREGEKMVSDYESTKRLLRTLDINWVILRCSINIQPIFFSVARAAHSLDIPAIEMQHGLEYNGEDSFSARKNTDYVAVYGSAVRRELGSAGVSFKEILEVGSPRFDEYQKTTLPESEKSQLLDSFGLTASKPTALFIATGGITPYDEIVAFEALRELQKNVPELQLIIKLRKNFFESLHRKLISRTLSSACTITMTEPLKSILALSDFVISSSSTVLLEAMASKKPLILLALNAYERSVLRYSFTPFIDTKAVLYATNGEELISWSRILAYNAKKRADMIAIMTQISNEQYMFDGHASERIVNFLNKKGKR